MLTRAGKLNAMRLRCMLLAIGTATGAIFTATPAMAACSIEGAGNIGNLGPNTSVRCTGLQQGIIVQSPNDTVSVNLDPSAALQEIPGNSITFTGSDSAVNLGTNALITDLDIHLNLAAQKIRPRLTLAGGARILNDDPVNQTSVNGLAALISLSTGAEIVTARSIILNGDGADLFMNGGTIAATSALTGPLIHGGMPGRSAPPTATKRG